MADSPTKRSLRLLRADGWMVYVCEKWIPQTKRRIDAYGFGDLLACRPGEIALVQTTSAANLAARVTKITNELTEEATNWFNAGGRIICHGWNKYAKPVDRKRWRAKTYEIVLTDDGLGVV